jgi:hypothetical protein
MATVLIVLFIVPIQHATAATPLTDARVMSIEQKKFRNPLETKQKIFLTAQMTIYT